MAAISAKPHRRITVALERTPYDVVIGDGSLNGVGQQMLDAGIRQGRRVLVAQLTVLSGISEPPAIFSFNAEGERLRGGRWEERGLVAELH